MFFPFIVLFKSVNGCSSMIDDPFITLTPHVPIENSTSSQPFTERHVQPNTDTVLDVLISLTHRNGDKLYHRLREASDPRSPVYGQWLDQEIIAEMIGIDSKQISQLKDFINQAVPSADRYRISNTQDHLFFQAKAGDIQTFFNDELGYTGVPDERHFASSLYIGHRTQQGDAAQNAFRLAFPRPLDELIELIQFYAPGHIYRSGTDEDLRHHEWLDNHVCEALDDYIQDREPLPPGVWKPAVDTYDHLNPAIIDSRLKTPLYVLKGTRGVADQGLIHVLISGRNGYIPHIPSLDSSNDSFLDSCDDQSRLWEYVNEKDLYSNIERLELHFTQVASDMKRLQAYPLTPDFVTIDCHTNCTVDELTGTCLTFRLNFILQTFVTTVVETRLVFRDGSVTEWDTGADNHPFATNEILDIPSIYDRYAFSKRYNGRGRHETRETVIVTSFLEEQFDPLDTLEFLRGNGLSTNDFHDRLYLMGPNDPEEGRMTGVEASLDMQVLMALATDFNVAFWNVPGRELSDGCEPLHRLAYQLSTWNTDLQPLPSIVSISYGNDEFIGIEKHLRRLDREFAKLALMGITVVTASGDDGANGRMARDLQDPHRCTRSSPSYPASLPSITSVGATQLSNQSIPLCHDIPIVLPPIGRPHCSSIGEVVAQTDMSGSLITSGGGFSYYFSRDEPSLWYQTKSADAYIEAMSSSGGLLPTYFNANGRGIPDIAMIGVNVPVVLGKKWSLLSGTSLSAPVASSVIANIKSSLKRKVGAERIDLGLFNPVLYAMAEVYPDVFNDVVVGKNACGYSGIPCCESGFEAIPGWDPASGLGSINVESFVDGMINMITEMHFDQVNDDRDSNDVNLDSERAFESPPLIYRS